MNTVKLLSPRLIAVAIMATVSFSSYSQTLTSNKGVIINGIKWAICNVSAPGTFTDKPEDAGSLYQWNRKKGWAATGSVTGWDKSTPPDATTESIWEKDNHWEKTNDPCPAGWHIPTLAEIKKLLDTDKVSNVWTTQNGVNGRKFTDRATGNAIFLPVAGYREANDGSLESAGEEGYYWSGTQGGGGRGYNIVLNNDKAYWDFDYRVYGFSIRPVAN